MTAYQFCYLNEARGLVRSTAMQCESDGYAIRKAFKVMHADHYSCVEIFDAERFVFRSPVWVRSEPARHSASRR